MDGSADFLQVSAVAFDYARGIPVVGIEVYADAEQLDGAVTSVAEEIARVRQHGFNDGEFDRAISRLRAAIGQELASEGTRQDWFFANSLVEFFLTGEPLPSAQVGHDLGLRALDEMTAEMVAVAFRTDTDQAPAVLVVGPDTSADSLPSEQQVLDILDSVAAADVAPREENVAAATTLMDRPEPAEIIDRREDALDVTWLEFANGAVVGLIETTITENKVVFGAASPGGVSVFPEPDVIEAQFIPEIVAMSGVGEFDRTALDQILTGEVAQVSLWLTDVEERMSGEAATEDLETLLQLIHLYVTQPRADETVAENFIGQIRPYFVAPLEIPGLASDVVSARARYGADNAWYAPPDVGELDTFDLTVALDAYRDRFGDVTDFNFVFAGDFSTADVEALMAAYIGTLPGSGRTDGAVDRQPDPPSGAVVETIEVGSDPQGAVKMVFTGELDATFEELAHVRLLELVVSTRLRDRIREALSATYSPSVTLSTYDSPDDIIETRIWIPGDPEHLDEISVETLAVLEALATEGPTEDELDVAKTQLVTDYQLVSNEFFVETLLYYASHPDESMGEINWRIAMVGATNVDDLLRVAATAWPSGQYIEVRQVPAG